MWSPDGGHFAFENDDRRSQQSGNDSLDDNELAYQIDKVARDSPRTVSTALMGSQFFVGSTTTTVEILQRTGPEMKNGANEKLENGKSGHVEAYGGDDSEDDDNNSIPPPPTMTMEENNHNGVNGNMRSGTLSPQPPNFPKPLLSSLESTEL